MSDTSPAAGQSSEAPGVQGAMPSGAMRSMFMVAAVLGVILVVGLLVLIGAVVVRITKGTPQEAASGEPLIAENLTLPKDGDVRRVWTDGDRLIIHAADPAGRGTVVVYDLRRGRVLARIGVK